MAVQTIKAKMYQRRDTTENWIKYNPVLSSGEFGYDTDKKKYKIGDGSTQWSDLPFSYIGEITDKNSEILKNDNVATEDFVTQHMQAEFFATKSDFPSTGDSSKLYIELENNVIYIWDSESSYKSIKIEASTLSEYGITDAYTKTEVDSALGEKVDKDTFVDNVRAVYPIIETSITDPITVNTIYDLGEQTELTIELPSGQIGDFIEFDFISGATATVLEVNSSDGLVGFDLIPSENTIYNLYFDWGEIGYDGDIIYYGWRFDYSEYSIEIVETVEATVLSDDTDDISDDTTETV